MNLVYFININVELTPNIFERTNNLLSNKMIINQGGRARDVAKRKR